ncbi:OmpH family outer membrane protein [Aquimarina hainanensis]|uniref:OmpH family outer membrane protein n=1 Tax=Aquimarina hainanensis TaxID=1578017 RepID=A0ABW5NAR9_9FLAO|nr:OmpH family outer membrane protein [Aquimarina sp. TRL1]QKX05778.1 OmpH family outer membrane protein [Aquimarina sp. TRL1]
MKKVVLSILFMAVSLTMVAQSKVGTIDSEFILSKMPELTKVQEDIKAYNGKLEAELKTKLDSYQALVKDYQAKEATMTDALKKTKQEEIIKLEGDINKFRQNGAQLAQLEQNKLLQPLYQKIGKALEEVAKAGGYSQVLTISNSGLAYIDPTFDLTKTVMTKLGIKAE